MPAATALSLFTALLIALAVTPAPAAAGSNRGTVEVRSRDGATAVTIDASGSVVAVAVGAITVPVTGAALNLSFGGALVPVVTLSSSSRATPEGGVLFERTVTLGGHTAHVRESFEPDDEGGVLWALEVNGTSPALWSPGIELGLELHDPSGSGRRTARAAASTSNASGWAVWAPWGEPACRPAPANAAACAGPCAASPATPLAPVPAPCYTAGAATFAYGSAVSVPLTAAVHAGDDVAVTLSVVPADNLISVTSPAVSVAGGGNGSGSVLLGVSFGAGYRVGVSAVPLRLAFHITGGAGCTRDVLGRYSRRHSEVFAPPNANVHYRASGMGSYTGMQGPLTQPADGVPLLDTLRATGYNVNWDATFWWPYIMMIAPTLRPSVPGGYDNATELWGSSFDKQPGFNNRLSRVHVHASYAIRDAYYKNWSDANVTVLGYFNGWELGQEMTTYPPDHSTCPSEPFDLWRNAPCFIHSRLDAALCRNANGEFQRNGWDGDTMLDPGMTVYREFLLEMVRNHLAMEPHFMGLASDGIRACVNHNGDDGMSCVTAPNGTCAPVQDGFTAWATLMSEVGPLLHGHDKLMSANTINGPHVHLMRHVDLSITEQNAAGLATVNVHGWLGLGKPVVMWTTGVSTSDALGPDHFFQRLLHRGLFPMPPMPSADHSLNPGDPNVHGAFMAYGPLFRALRGRTWVLRPHAVSVRVLGGGVESKGGASPVGGGAGSAVGAASALPSPLSRESPKASLAPCDAKDPAQRWRNATFVSGACPGALESASGAGCLVVFNPQFTPTGCGSGAAGSEIWTYPCPPPSPSLSSQPPPPSPPLPRLTVGPGRQRLSGARDCPLHENIRWELAGTQLRSAVPDGAPGPVDWTLCLTRVPSGPRYPLTLAKCEADAPEQGWRVALASGGAFQLQSADGQQCVSAKPAAPPPVPPMPPAVNLFEDRSGALVVVVTSPGALVNATVQVTVSGTTVAVATTATVVRPGDAAPQPLAAANVTRSGSDMLVTVTLRRGAAVVRVVL